MSTPHLVAAGLVENLLAQHVLPSQGGLPALRTRSHLLVPSSFPERSAFIRSPALAAFAMLGPAASLGSFVTAAFFGLHPMVGFPSFVALLVWTAVFRRGGYVTGGRLQMAKPSIAAPLIAIWSMSSSLLAIAPWEEDGTRIQLNWMALVLGPVGDVLMIFEAWMWCVFVTCTIGTLFWAPVLGATWVVYGWPLTRAQRYTLEGVDGEERGHRLVSMVGAFISSIAALACLFFPRMVERNLRLSCASTALFLNALTIGIVTLREAQRKRAIERAKRAPEGDLRLLPVETGYSLIEAHDGIYRENRASVVAELDSELRVKHVSKQG